MRFRSMRALAVLAVLSSAALPLHAAQDKSKTASHKHTLSGEIAGYEESSHTLTLKTSKGSTSFGVEEAKVYVSSKSVGLDEIGKQVGTTASVTYTMKNGQRAASSVRITPAKSAHKS